MLATESSTTAAHPPPLERDVGALAVLARAVDRIAAGFPAEAVNDLEQLCAEHPDWAVARAYYGIALLGIARVTEARETLEDAVALAPDSFICHLRYGEFLARTGFYDRAAEQLGIALHLSPPDTGARDAAAMLRSYCLQRARGMFYRETPNLRSRLQPLLSWFARPCIVRAATTPKR